MITASPGEASERKMDDSALWPPGITSTSSAETGTTADEPTGASSEANQLRSSGSPAMGARSKAALERAARTRDARTSRVGSSSSEG